MVGRFLRRSAKFDLRPWMLKQVQHDEVKGPLPTTKADTGTAQKPPPLHLQSDRIRTMSKFPIYSPCPMGVHPRPRIMPEGIWKAGQNG